MIFVTVGTQLAFDRLVMTVDEWAARHPEVEIFAQIGPASRRPGRIPHEEFLSPARVEELLARAELVVSHAGMGTILGALRLRRPIVILPRRAEQGEHRNDHQAATARWLATRPGVHVAADERDLVRLLDARGTLAGGAGIEERATGPLVERLTGWIRG